MVAFSDELPVGGVLKMNYFGQAQVTYGARTGLTSLHRWTGA